MAKDTNLYVAETLVVLARRALDDGDTLKVNAYLDALEVALEVWTEKNPLSPPWEVLR